MCTALNIVVASRNPVKISAVREAFSRQFPNAELELISVGVESAVSDQPEGDDETRQGAKNRVEAARLKHPDAHYWVGLEGGVGKIDDQLMAFAWMVVGGSNGKTGEARTATLPLPPAVQELVARGAELGEANDRVFSTINSKHAGGAFGLLTDGLYTREQVYCEALIFALVPFVHELFSQETMGATPK